MLVRIWRRRGVFVAYPAAHMRILDAPSEGSIAREVWAVERHSKENVAIVQTADGSAMRILTMPDVALSVGEKLVLSFDPEKAYLFSS